MAPAPAQSTVVTVLWVSSHADDLPALGKVLTGQEPPDCPDCRFEVITADNVEAALRVLESARIPVVLCERELGKDTWKTLLARMAQLEEKPYLIVASRSADESLWAEALNLGVYDVLARPFVTSEVARTLSLAWLRWNEAARPRRAVA